MKSASSFVLATWSEKSLSEDGTGHSNLYFVLLYALLAVGEVPFFLIGMLALYYKNVELSKKLHFNMFKRIIRAPLNLFFDRVPKGRLINRFASDLDTIDSMLPHNLNMLVHIPIELFARFIICWIAGTFWAFPLGLVFLFVGIKLQQAYLNVFREATRLSKVLLYIKYKLDFRVYYCLTSDKYVC